MRWTYQASLPEQVAALSSSLGAGPVLAELLLRAGHLDAEAAGAFLRPALARRTLVRLG